MPTFDVDAAKKAGYNDQEIQSFIVKNNLRPKMSVGGFVNNVGKSAVNTVKDIGSAVLNPIDTVTNLGKVGLGAAQLLLPGEQGLEQNARNVGTFYKNRYGSLNKIANTLYTDPVGSALDASVILGGAGTAIKGLGAVTKSARLADIGANVARVGSAIDPIAQVGKGFRAAGSNIFKKLPGKLNAASENIATRGIGNPAKQAEAARKGGRSVASFIDQYNLYDRSPETAGQVKNSILGQYDDISLNSGTMIPSGDIIKLIDDEIAKLSSGDARFSEAAQTQVAELVNRRQQLLQAMGATENMSPAFMPTKRVTEFRRNALDPDIPQSMYNLDAKGSGKAIGAKTTRNVLRKAINSTDPRLDQLGKDYGMAKTMEKILQQSEARGNNRQLFSLSDAARIGAGGFAGGIPGAALSYATGYVANDPRVLAGTSRSLKGIAKNIESGGLQRRLNKVGSGASGAYSFGKTAKIATPTASTTTQSQYPMQSNQSEYTQSQSRSYPAILPQPPIPPKKPNPKKIKALEYKAPKATLSTNSGFGKSFTLKKSNAY